MKRILSLLAIAAMAAIINTGCDDVSDLVGETNDDAATITLAVADTLTASQGSPVVGELEGSPSITSAAYTITSLEGYTVVSSEWYTVTSVAGLKKANLEDDAGLTITPPASTINGKYELTISIVAGSASLSKADTFTVIGGVDSTIDTSGTPVVVDSVVAGAQNSSYGSSIDLDVPVVYSSADAANHVAELDLCYGYSNTDTIEKLFSPKHIKDSGFAFASSWTNPPATQFYKLSGVSFDAITTEEEIVGLWNANNASTTSIDADLNDVFIVKTTAGATALLLIADQTDGASGNIKIKVAK